MGDDKKTIDSFLAIINPILKTKGIELDLLLHKEAFLEYYIMNGDYEKEFPPVDLHELCHGDTVVMHYFLTVDKIINAGFCVADFDDDNKIVAKFVNMDSIHPPQNYGTKYEAKICVFVRVIIDSLNQYLKGNI